MEDARVHADANAVVVLPAVAYACVPVPIPLPLGVEALRQHSPALLLEDDSLQHAEGQGNNLLSWQCRAIRADLARIELSLQSPMRNIAAPD